MSVAENKAAFLKWIEEGWNGGDLSVVDELYQPHYVTHSLLPGFPTNREGLKQFVAMFRAAMPDFHMHPEAVIGEGDTVIMRFRATGTQQGELLGIPATGKQMDVTGTITARFEDARWVEDWASWDQLGLLRQLGAIPTPEPATR